MKKSLVELGIGKTSGIKEIHFNMIQQKVVRFSNTENVYQATLREIENDFIFDKNIIELYSDNLQKTRQAFQKQILNHINKNTRILEIGTTPLLEESNFFALEHISTLHSTREVVFNELGKTIYTLIIVEINKNQPFYQSLLDKILENASLPRFIYFLHEEDRPIISPNLRIDDFHLQPMINVIDYLSFWEMNSNDMEWIYRKHLYWIMI